MDVRGLAARMHDQPTLRRRAWIALMLGVTAALAWAALNSTTADLPLALWWPAAASSVVAMLISRGRRLVVAGLIFVIMLAVNMAYGRALDLSAAYALANTVELALVAWLLTRRGRPVRLVTLPNVGWFLIAATAGALVAGLIAGAGAGVFLGADPIAVTLAVFTSHGSALFALVPLALVPLTTPLRTPWWEPLAQGAALIALSIVVFAPAAALALTFLIITTLMWGAYRLPPLVPAIQSILLAGAATGATALNFGPFAELVDHDPRGAIFALQLFIMTHAAAGLFVAGQSADWQATTDALAERERQARQVAENLRQLNTQKDDFISAVSHELRTPVTSILGFSEMLTEADLDTEAAQAGRIIHRNARRLADTIEDVLELSRLTAQGGVRQPTDIDVRAVLRECVEDARGIAVAGREPVFALTVPATPVMVRAIAQDLSRVCSNLLTNAVKFSPPHGRVTVTLTEHPEEVEVSIADEGPGIPLAEQEAVWERFYRVQSDRHRDVPGTGLGLPIVRSLIEHRLGGSVTLNSDGEHGTTMVVRVPRVPSETLTAPRRSQPTAL